MRCSWLHRLLGRIAPQKPGNAAVVRRRLWLGRGSSRLARLCRRLRIHVVAGRRRLGNSSGSGAGAASLGLFFEPGGRPRFFAEGELFRRCIALDDVGLLGLGQRADECGSSELEIDLILFQKGFDPTTSRRRPTPPGFPEPCKIRRMAMLVAAALPVPALSSEPWSAFSAADSRSLFLLDFSIPGGGELKNAIGHCAADTPFLLASFSQMSGNLS